jgi:hypothetical protein
MTKIIPRKLTEQRGSVLIVTALLLIVLLGFTAFAIDFGNAYIVKNELQNAADAAALAGASVLFSANELCIGSDHPYDCCTGSKAGNCNPSTVDDNNVRETAKAVAAKNYSSGNQAPVPTVEIGHYKFASSRAIPGTFTATQTYQQMTNWETVSFNTLNDYDGTGGKPMFINSVKATVSRTNVPRFFSRIWSSSDLAITANAVAYVGFAGTLEPGAADQPIGICAQSIKNDEGNYTCNTGRMLNSGGNASTHNTAAWTNFTQPCETANPPTLNPLVCGEGNPQPIMLGGRVGSTGGTDTSVLKNLRDNCFKPKTRTEPLNMTLPVIDCPGNNPGNCSKVLGAVNVDVVWISEKDADTEGKFAAEDFPPSRMGDWTCPSGYSRIQCWNHFVQWFKLKNVDDATATYAQKSIYFLPTCTPHEPSGNTGGENYGVMARYPVLVK